MPERARWPRQRSIRALLSLGLVVPLVCLVALWGFGTDVTMTRAAAMHDFTAVDRLYSGPAQALSSALAAEQLQTATWLSAGHVGPVGPLRAQFRATDRAAASFLAAARADRSVISMSAQPALHSLESLLASRAALRTAALAGRFSALVAIQAYGEILTALNDFDASLLVADNASLSRQAAATVEADDGVDLARTDIALVSVAVAGDAMTTPERLLFGQDAAQAQLIISGAVSVLTPALGSGYQLASSSGANRALFADQGQLGSAVAAAGVVAVRPPAFAATAAALNQLYQAAERQDVTGLANLATQASGTATLAEVLVAGLGLVAVLLSGLLAINLWWRIIGAVSRLQQAALPLAGDGLAQPSDQPNEPRANARPPRRLRWPTGGIREIANASAALSAAQQLAHQAAAAQDQLRIGSSQLLRNLGRRSHALADRQIRLLDVIERGISDPHALAGLAAVGQLSTRMRRHADGLLVLSGGSLARSGHGPLPIGDLIRAATADVDDGLRISVVSDSPEAVTADAVADVLHLIGELVDNAVRHTPQLAEVTVRTGRAGRGLVIEVENDGPGFDLDSANALLADPPDIGLAVGDGLGLLVVARLAARHGITVNLRNSPTGGTDAIVLLPHAILVADEVRDTIVDGSLPRIDAAMPPPEAPSGYVLPGLPQRVADPGAAPAGQLRPTLPRRVADPGAVPPGQVRPTLPLRIPDPGAVPPGQVPPTLPQRVADPGAAPPGQVPPTLPQRVADPGAVPPTRRTAPYPSPQPVVTPTSAPAAENSAPWYWLTASQPARTSAPEPAGPAVDEPRADAGDSAAPAPLPRRVRPTASASGRSAAATPPRPGLDQQAAPDAGERAADDAAGATPGAQQDGGS
jgi:signal transduction histidine kinase